MAKKASAKKGSTQKKKRTVSGKRGSVQKRGGSGTDIAAVAGVVITCLGVLSMAAQFIPTSGGFLRACNDLVHGLGGTLCLLLPLVVCWAGVTMVFAGAKRVRGRTAVCGVLIFLFVEALLELFQVGTINTAMAADGAQQGYLPFLARAYTYSVQDWSRGGGLLGALLAWPLVEALDVWGAVIALVFACALTLLLLTGVSASSVGMALSNWLDDWRVSAKERREERGALREIDEEEALTRDTEAAMERARRRIAHQSELEAQEEEEEKEEEREPVRAPKPAPKAQKRAPAPKAQTSRPAPERAKGASYEPNDDVRSTPRPRPLRPVQQTPLYIEQDDEFVREGIDDRREMSGARRRRTFTVQEAEQAFLHGATFSGYAETMQPLDDVGAQGEALQRDEQPLPVTPPAQDAQRVVPFAAQDAADAVQTPTAEGALQEGAADSAQDADAPQVWSAGDADGVPDAESAADTADWADAQDAQGTQTATEDEEPDAPPSAHEPMAWGEAAQGVPSSIPASGLRRPRQTPLQTQPEEEKVIVQLREGRMDGTPLVMPAKPEHEMPKAEEVYEAPPLDLLERGHRTQDVNQRAKDEAGAAKLLQTLESFGVQAKLTHVTHGPAITRYEVQPAPGVKVSRIVSLVDDIALNMASDGVRIEAPIPGKPAVGIEIPNEKIETVSLRDVLESPEMQRQSSPTAVALGKGISGAPVIADIAKMPHVLIAGATGSGKSVCINTIINSIIYRASPRDVRLILIDPKVVELSVYNGIPHLLVPVVTDPKKASAALSWAVVEMEHRYKRFEAMGVREIGGYNRAIGADEEPMSKIIVIIDELADLMMVAPGEVEESICRLAQLARAAGIHLVIATQRPSVNVITGVIKANIPSRIAFAVSSQIDSRTILDSGGAEKLLGKGDMLYAPQGAGKPTRVQGCFVSDEEVQRIVEFVLGAHKASYSEDVIEQLDAAAQEEKAAQGETPGTGEQVDEMLQKAIELAIDAGQVSISMLQRRLRVGYARAGRLVDEMTQRGIAAEAEGPTKPRAVLITREQWKAMNIGDE